MSDRNSFFGEPKKENDGTYHVEAMVGVMIENAVCDGIKLAKQLDAPVEFDFNNIGVRVDKTDDPAEVVARWSSEQTRKAEKYRNSPEGKRAARKQAKEVLENQKQVDRLVKELDELDFTNLDAVVGWMESLTTPSDHRAVKVPCEKIVSAFVENGYLPNAFVGEKEKVKNDREACARWLIGQGVSNLQSVGAIHGMFLVFAERWRENFAASV